MHIYAILLIYNFKFEQVISIYIEVLNINFYIYYNNNSNENIKATQQTLIKLCGSQS